MDGPTFPPERSEPIMILAPVYALALAALRLVAQTLLVAVFFHPLTAFVFGDFCFSSFFQRAHRGVFTMPISECQLSASETTKRDRYLSRAAKVKGMRGLATHFGVAGINDRGP
jgi:hypothetical protein